ncbi:MAG: hypothetical protein DMF62_15875 [Acidobacteria bacterium]|nr:MAG: hypothetical protein DMF62_15875 [Acidobacteriota bacterium]
MLIKNFASWNDEPGVIWICNFKPKEVNSLVDVVGVIGVTIDYMSTEQRHRFAYTSGWKSALINVTSWQFESEKTKSKPKKTLTIKELLQRSFFERLFGN